MIFEGSVIQAFTHIGNNVMVWSSNHIGHRAVIKDHAFISAHVVIGGGAEIGEQCFLGINSTVRDHIRIGDRCVVGAGAMMMNDVPSGGVYRVPATSRLSKDPSTLRL